MKNRILACLMLCAVLPAGAQAPATDPGMLPVRAVTLFTSGVAYTERAGTVDGNATIPLVFRTGQINDILKSMVLLDQGGQVQAATYATRDPVGHTLQAFAVDVTSNLSQEQILSRLRGVKVSIETPGKPALTGQIAGVEQRQVAGEDNKPVNALFLNLLTDNGLIGVRLDGDKTVRLLDERLNREFHDALALLATGSDDQRRQVTLHFSGDGKRQVRVGYVLEAPVWKMSYRLLLGGADPTAAAGRPYLQGWAMVENTSDEDWRNVRLSLVSGRPVSFIQDLYQPLYVPRPVVGPDIIASTMPQTHEGDLLVQRHLGAMMGSSRPMGSRMPMGGGSGMGMSGGPAGPQGPAGDAGETGTGGTGGIGGFPGGGRADEAEAAKAHVPSLGLADTEAIRQSVIAQAQGQQAGELFQYNISTPVDLPRQQAALIPVVAQDVEAEKLLLYNADSGSRFPLDAVRLHNTTTLHLKGGPVTLFDAGVYAGDARMEDIPPGDTRLISYAVDLSVEGARQGPSQKMMETTFTLKRGVLTITRRQRVETEYTLKSRSDRPHTILVEHPYSAGYKLIAPDKPAERTASLYRFAVPLAPGKSQSLKVVMEAPISQEVGILDNDMNELIAYSTNTEMSSKLRAVLQEVVARRRRVQDLTSQAAARAAEVQSINGDQERIRKNMTALDKSSALYKRYVGELDAQETKIESLRQEATRLQAQAEATNRDLRAYIDGLAPLD
jgi:hypothetical protein